MKLIAILLSDDGGTVIANSITDLRHADFEQPSPTLVNMELEPMFSSLVDNYRDWVTLNRAQVSREKLAEK